MDAQENKVAHAAGRMAARASRPLTDCPYDANEQPVLTMWFIRGYRSIQSRGGDDPAAPAATTESAAGTD